MTSLPATPPSLPADQSPSPTPSWHDDYLSGCTHYVISLGDDPDGEGIIRAVLTHYVGDSSPAHKTPPAVDKRPAVLYVHGLNDYFFQVELARFFNDLGIAFYALDLRKCGRALLPEQNAHMVSNLQLYDQELNEALGIIHQRGHCRWFGMAHSTGGLVIANWVSRLRSKDTAWMPSGLIMNSPWWDLAHGPFLRSPLGTACLWTLGTLFPRTEIPGQRGDAYGRTLHISREGEWDYRTEWKRLNSVPKQFGWFWQIRKAQLKLHRGLDLDLPVLVLSSDRSGRDEENPDRNHTADVVLDIADMQRWAPAVSSDYQVVQIPDARHDVFLSLKPARQLAYQRLQEWLYDHDHSLHM